MLFKIPPIGINFSDYSIEIISLVGSIEKPKLLALARKTLESGIVEDGRILEKEKLEEVLKDLILKPDFGQIRTKKIIFSLPESKIFLHLFELPEILEKEKAKKEVEFQAIHNLPFPLADLHFDFIMKEKEVLLAAIQKDIVEDYLDVFEKLKLQPVALEIESISLARSLIENKEETILILDIGARTTNLGIFDENGLRLSITIDIAGNKFSQALAEKLNLPFLEAENLKKEIGLNPEKREGKVFLILQKEIQGIIAEIKKIEEYFQEKEQKVIEKIILAGGSAALPHLAEYLTDNLEKLVIVGDPWKKINIDILRKKEYFKEALKVNPILYAPVIGSALRGLAKNPQKSDINLLPKS
jgi:type IV pilus assembly protein PilM